MENNRCNYNDRTSDRNYQNRIRAEREELGSIVQNRGYCCEHKHHMPEHYCEHAHHRLENCCATGNSALWMIMLVLIGIFVLQDH